MNDLTILYYSSSRIADHIAQNFREELVKVVGNKYPIVSVTQKPIDLKKFSNSVFGYNICVGEIGQSYYNAQKQALIGLREVKTPYVAIAEDDTLYTKEHFAHRPSSDDVIAYQRNMWFLDTRTFWTKMHTGMFGAIAPTKYLLENYERRFERFPEEMMPRSYHKWFFIEPGFDERLGFAKANTETFETEPPLISFAYYGATYGKPKRRLKTSSEVEELPYWGSAQELRSRLENLSSSS